MKKLFITITLLVLPAIVFAYKSPGQPQGFVSDFANIIDAQVRTQMESRLSQFEKQSGVEIAVVTVNNIDGETVETFAVKLFEEWKIGKAGKDNGILFLIAPNEREVRLEVGYGMEGVVTDLIANNIIQKEVIPQFKQNNYTQGIQNGLDALLGIIDKTIDPNEYSQNKNNLSFFNIIDPRIILFALFIVSGGLLRFLSKSKSWWMGGLIGAVVGLLISIFVGFLFTGLIITLILIVIGLIMDFFASKGGPGSFHGGFGGFGGGGSSSGGGFGGFGGGFSGGGGASGRW